MSTYTQLLKNGYQTPDTKKNPSAASLQQKRAALPGITTPSSTRPCLPALNQGYYGLQNKQFYAAEYATRISTYDVHDSEDVNHVPGYVTDIYQRLYFQEVSTTYQRGWRVNKHMFMFAPASTFFIPYV
jgi:hypothetical protein